jgi:predicted RNA binding protein YcfA (HicA-like mRNA interferase family)
MSRFGKLLLIVLRGTSDANLAFDDLCYVLRHLGFVVRVNGDHHIFSHPEIEEIVNVQPRNGKAKPYQVKQVRHIILKYGWGGEPDEQ